MKANLQDIQKTYNEIPNTWVFEDNQYIGYKKWEELHYQHGWRDVVLPEYNPETHKLSDTFILVDDKVTKEVLPLTEAEIEEVKKTKKQESLNQIKSKYELHRNNGWNAYQEFRANIVTEINQNVLTEEQAFEIEHYLKVAYDRIAQNGDWKTARFELLKVTGYPNYVKKYYDLALGVINNYIEANYE